jgi:hypothetical protein
MWDDRRYGTNIRYALFANGIDIHETAGRYETLRGMIPHLRGRVRIIDSCNGDDETWLVTDTSAAIVDGGIEKARLRAALRAMGSGR